MGSTCFSAMPPDVTSMVASLASRVCPTAPPPTTFPPASSPRPAREPPRPPPAPTADIASASKDSPESTAACRPSLSKLTQQGTASTRKGQTEKGSTCAYARYFYQSFSDILFSIYLM